MNRDQWIESAEALLHLDEKKLLVPHGIGGHARTILEEAVTLLRAHNSDSAEPVAWFWTRGGDLELTILKDGEYGKQLTRGGFEPKPLYLASPPAKEVNTNLINEVIDFLGGVDGL